MAIVEQYQGGELLTQLPRPGSVEHLEYLALLEPSDELSSAEYLDYNNPTRTFCLFTKRIPKHRPIRANTIELDSRSFNKQEGWIPAFNSTIYRHPTDAHGCLLQIHGQPKPWELGKANLTYDITLPILYDFTHDASRKTQAVIRHGQGLLDDWEVYNELADPWYGEDNPQVLQKAIACAARDMASLVKYVYDADLVPAYIEERTQLGEITPTRQRVAQVIANLLK